MAYPLWLCAFGVVRPSSLRALRHPAAVAHDADETVVDLTEPDYPDEERILPLVMEAGAETMLGTEV